MGLHLRVKRVVFNGKFTSVKHRTGVHRVAGEILHALDDLLAEEQARLGMEWVLMCPPGADPLPQFRNIRTQVAGSMSDKYWEQFELPWLARKGLVVSLCNNSPLLTRAAIVMMHDAQAFSTPASYTKSFVSFYRFAMPRIGRSASKILTVSEFSKSELVKYGIAEPEKIQVVPNGVDHVMKWGRDDTVLDRVALGGRPFVVAFANRGRHKNVDILLEAFRSPKLAGVALVLVGGPEPSAPLQACSNVLTVAHPTDAQLASLYESAVCLAFPSLTEGFGLPPLEAMSVSCPVVAAPCGALPEVCGASAVYADPHDPSAWADAISSLVEESSADRKARCDIGRDHARAFTWERSASAVYDVIRNALTS